MAKIDVETTKFILQRHEKDIRKINEIMQDIEMELKAEEEERANRPPPVKKQFAVILADQTVGVDEILEETSLSDLDITGWVVQIPEDESVASAPERIIRAAYEFNTTPKGRRMPVQTIGEACEAVTAKLLKEQDVWVKTKIPVLAVPTRNKIPLEKAE